VPSISRRAIGFVLFALAVSAGCVRLGFWQLHRLAERRALNAMLASRLGGAPRPVREIIADSSAAEYRRVTATGTYDFANEFALASRTRQGSPGVNIITPLRLAGTDTAVLINRGWVYAPDAMTADLARWREPTEATVSGYLLQVNSTARGPVTAPSNARVLRHLQRDSIRSRLSYPIASFLIVATEGPTAARDSTPARLTAPMLDEGPHLGYAFQWFAFALIGLVGAGVGVRADRRGTFRRAPVPLARPTRQ
jgi:surfeit locus 1 family protein